MNQLRRALSKGSRAAPRTASQGRRCLGHREREGEGVEESGVGGSGLVVMKVTAVPERRYRGRKAHGGWGDGALFGMEMFWT